jgi:phosphomannomutase
MQPDKVFKRYDIRGRYPEEVDEQFFTNMGKAIGTLVLERYGENIVVCRDNKESSESLKESLIDGIKSTGADVIDVGVGPTDYASFHGSERSAVSVQVTSSHMPMGFNGLKFMYPEGNGFMNQELDLLKQLFQQEGFTEGQGEIRTLGSAREEYISSVVDFAEQHVKNLDRKIVVDSLGGSTDNFLAEILERLGFDVVEISEGREGIYRTPPAPQEQNLEEEVEEMLKEENAYMGFATDLDGDRAKIFFEGEWISGDDLFCILAQVSEGEVAASIDTSRKIEKFAEKVHYTRVGDPFVAEKMLETDAILSGEPNGHYCIPEFVNYNSGCLTCAVSACLDLGKLLENVPKTSVVRKNLSYDERTGAEEKMEKLKQQVRSEFEVLSDIDGIKFEIEDSTVLARLSGSSDLIRVKAEADSREQAEKAASQVEQLLRKQ